MRRSHPHHLLEPAAIANTGACSLDILNKVFFYFLFAISFTNYHLEVLLHQYESCGYDRLLRQVEQLQEQLVLKDVEIVRLNDLLAERV